MKALILIFGTIFNLLTLLALAAVVLLMGTNFLSATTPYKLYTVRSGSMEPAIPLGSLIITHPQESYREGEIITFLKDGETVTHRLFRSTSQGFQTKGDANADPDGGTRHPGDIIGVARLNIPYAGYPLAFIKTFPGYLLLVLVPGALVVLREIWIIGRELEKKQTQKKSVSQASVLLAAILTFSLAGNSAAPTNAYFVDSDVNLGNLFRTGSFLPPSLVINEVYFPKDGAAAGSPCAGAITVDQSNVNTGPGSSNENSVDSTCTSTYSQENSANARNSFDLSATTGGNTQSDNTVAGTVNNGNVTIDLRVINLIGGNANPLSDQWIELYNPTNSAVSLGNWKLSDGAGNVLTIRSTRKIPAQGFAAIVRSAGVLNRFSPLPASTVVISAGQLVGDGLSRFGDSLRLINPDGTAIDSLSWGSEMSGPHYGNRIAGGTSIERQPRGLDTNQGGDFVSRTLPTPGQ